MQHHHGRGDPVLQRVPPLRPWRTSTRHYLAVEQARREAQDDINKQIKEFDEEEHGLHEEFNEWATFYAEVAFQRNAFNGFALPGSSNAIPCTLEPDAIEAQGAQLGDGVGRVGPEPRGFPLERDAVSGAPVAQTACAVSGNSRSTVGTLQRWSGNDPAPRQALTRMERGAF